MVDCRSQALQRAQVRDKNQLKGIFITSPYHVPKGGRARGTRRYPAKRFLHNVVSGKEGFLREDRVD
jgi:hypothetical protein